MEFWVLVILLRNGSVAPEVPLRFESELECREVAAEVQRSSGVLNARALCVRQEVGK